MHIYSTSNEPVLSYAPGSPERQALLQAYRQAISKTLDIPMYIGGKEIRTNKTIALRPPHDHTFVLGNFHEGDRSHVEQAIEAALTAQTAWAQTPWKERAAVFLKAADLLATTYRFEMNAATMLGQSKNAYQAEIDSACELIDFLRFNAEYLEQIQSIQPASTQGVLNSLEYRPLEGFVFAVSPFNFTAIGGNLAVAPAIAGNVVVWKPAYTQIYSAQVLMKILIEAGLPPGVINLIYTDGPTAGEVIFRHPAFAGLHFTGSTRVFQQLYKTIGLNIERYRTYPRIVGETGGKGFVVAHPSAKLKVLTTALIRGAFEYQGQKCSAASRAYIPASLWPALRKELIAELDTLNMGSPEQLENFVNAVIDRTAYDKITGYIEMGKRSAEATLIYGGWYSADQGYFIKPTVFEVSDPQHVLMKEEIFGPVLTVWVYADEALDQMLEWVDRGSSYALTGAIISEDQDFIAKATRVLYQAAGNFYINDKPTGAVVNQQPFGGARASGTNDKAGSILNLLRWVSPRTLKVNQQPPENYRYPFLEK